MPTRPSARIACIVRGESGLLPIVPDLDIEALPAVVRGSGGGAMQLIANTRMYGVGERCRRLWNELVAHISDNSGVPLKTVEHAAPAPVTDLWARPDMGLVQMCGWPFWRSHPRPNLVAAPVLDHELCRDRPLYWTDMVVRHDEPAERLEDLFQRRFGWTTEHSHSGYNAPRRMLLPHFLKSGKPVFSESLGQYKSPMGIIEALLDDEIDVGPVDGYFHLLLERHQPDIAARLRTIAVSDVAPIPPFVASHGILEHELERLRHSAVQVHLMPAAKKVMDDLLIGKFVLPEAGVYETTEKWSREAIAKGYVEPA